MNTFTKALLGTGAVVLVVAGIAHADGYRMRDVFGWGGYGPHMGWNRGGPMGGPGQMGQMGGPGMMGPMGGPGMMGQGMGPGGQMPMHGLAFGAGFGNGRGDRMEMMFSRFDGNNDGVVTLEEVLNVPDTRFTDIDTNKDGVVDKDEADAAIVKQFSAMRDRMIARFDTNGDGKVSKEEAETPIKKRFALFDTNNDGKVTKDEITNSGPMFGPGMGPHRWMERWFGGPSKL